MNMHLVMQVQISDCMHASWVMCICRIWAIACACMHPVCPKMYQHMSCRATCLPLVGLQHVQQCASCCVCACLRQESRCVTALLLVLQSISSGSALKGAAFWAWYAEGQMGPEGEGGGDGLYGIRDTSSTFALVRDSAKTIAG